MVEKKFKFRDNEPKYKIGDIAFIDGEIGIIEDIRKKVVNKDKQIELYSNKKTSCKCCQDKVRLLNSNNYFYKINDDEFYEAHIVVGLEEINRIIRLKDSIISSYEERLDSIKNLI